MASAEWVPQEPVTPPPPVLVITLSLDEARAVRAVLMVDEARRTRRDNPHVYEVMNALDNAILGPAF